MHRQDHIVIQEGENSCAKVTPAQGVMVEAQAVGQLAQLDVLAQQLVHILAVGFEFVTNRSGLGKKVCSDARVFENKAACRSPFISKEPKQKTCIPLLLCGDDFDQVQ